MDNSTKDGNSNTVTHSLRIGSLSSKFTAEGPIGQSKKTTFLVGGRTTYSNWFLQYLPDATFKEFSRILKPGGVVIFSTLGPDTLKELRAAFTGVDGYEHVNQFIDMHDIGDALVKHGLTNSFGGIFI